MILIDTHSTIWMTEGDPSIGRTARETIEREARAREALVSAVTFWEVGMLVSKGRLALSMPLPEWAEFVVSRARFAVEAVDAKIALEAGMLPEGIHGDPGDRFLIATARLRRAPIVTADRKILAYAKLGHVEAIDARC